MRNTLLGLVESVARKSSQSWVSNVPGITFVYRRLIRMLESKDLDSQQWIEYEGHDLKIAPPDHVSKQLAKRGYYEKKESDFIRKVLSEGDVALDLGAHIGHHTVTMRDCVGESGRVIAVEANPKNAEHISETVAKNRFDNVIVVDKAVAASEGTMTLHVNTENTGAASVLKGQSETVSVEIEASRLNPILKKNGSPNIDFVKIDVQGAERDIIPQLDLSSIDNMLLEVHCGEFLSSKEVKTIHDELSEHGTIRTLNGEDIDNPAQMDRDAPLPIYWVQGR